MKKMIRKIFKKNSVIFKRLSDFCVRFVVAIPSMMKTATKRIMHLVKNPKLILTAFLLTFHRMKKFFKKFPRSTREYFFLMVMSAESNVERFRRIGIRDVPHVKEVSEYQKYARKKTFKVFVTGLATIILVISVPIIFQNRFAQSKTYQWIQNSWVGGISASTATALNGWTNYFSKTGGNAITADGNGVALYNVPSTPVLENGTSYAYSGVNGASGSGVYKTAINTVQLKSPVNGTCTITPNCADGVNQQCYNSLCKLNVGQNCSGVSSNCTSGVCSTTCQAIATGNPCFPNIANGQANSNCSSNWCYAGTCRVVTNGVCGPDNYDGPGGGNYCTSGSPSGGNHVLVDLYTAWYNYTCSGLYGGSPSYTCFPR